VKANRTYFQTFDAMRFFAFFKVFLFHIPIWGFPFFDFIKRGGGTAVSFFFALSGFLITYIVLEEKRTTATFDLKAFYIRRVLRIWPLYYAMLIFAFMTPFILSVISIDGAGQGYEPDWLMSAFFLENYKMIATDSFPNVSPLGVMWSLCVEEHFYIVWGLVLYFVAIKNIRWAILLAVVLANGARSVFYMNDWVFLDLLTNVDYFAYGAIPAILLIQYKDYAIAFLTKFSAFVKVLILFSGILLFLIFPNLEFKGKLLIEPTILGLTFAMLLTLVVLEERLFTISSKNIFSGLGMYTYGFYLTHPIVINLFAKIFDKMNLSLLKPITGIMFIFICLLCTILTGICSYYLIEKPFLRLKKRFS